jgi:outer membrane protein OmpA-like peptidoglycan-associated protein
MRHTNTSLLRFIVSLSFLFSLGLSVAQAQTDITRQSVAITYPLDQTVKVKLKGTTIQPRLEGDVEAKRTGRTGTRVKLSVRNLTRAAELGHIYTVYVLWAVSPEGIMDNLGEIRRGGSALTESKLEVTSRLPTFALIVTAEPHSLVPRPSRLVIMENIRPVAPFAGEVAPFTLPQLGNSSDEFRDRTLPGLPTGEDYDKTPVSLLGARRALALSRFAGAERWATAPYKDAVQKLNEAENAHAARVAEAEVDLDARSAIRLAIRAEDEARAAKNAFDSREREKKNARELQTIEERADSEKSRAETAEKRAEELQRELDQTKNRLFQVENDLDQAKSQVAFLKPENERLNEENKRLGAQRDEAKSRADQLQGELNAARNANPAPVPTPRPDPSNGGNNDGGDTGGRVVTEEDRRAAAAAFKANLQQFGTVKETERGLTLTFPETVWINQKASTLKPAASAQMDSLAALLASSPEYQIFIESFTDNTGNADALRRLTQDRAQFVADRFTFAGVDGSRIIPNGLGPSRPVAPNTPKTRAKNRRTEIIFVPLPAQ